MLGHIFPTLNWVEEKMYENLYCEKNISKNDEVTDDFH